MTSDWFWLERVLNARKLWSEFSVQAPSEAWYLKFMHQKFKIRCGIMKNTLKRKPKVTHKHKTGKSGNNEYFPQIWKIKVFNVFYIISLFDIIKNNFVLLCIWWYSVDIHQIETFQKKLIFLGFCWYEMEPNHW